MDNMWMLAQTETNRPSFDVQAVPSDANAQTKQPAEPNIPTTGTQPKGFFGGYEQLLFIILIFVVMYLMLFRGPQKQRQERKKLVQSLKKNDKVQTIGGIFGTIVDIKGDEITMKVDESNNTKIKVTSSAIGKNLSQDKS